MKLLPTILMLLTLVGLLGLGHMIVFYAMRSAWTLTSPYTSYLAWGLVILSVSFFASSLLINSVYSQIGSWLYTASAVWLGTLYRLVIASIIILLGIGIVRLIGGHAHLWLSLSKGLLIIALCVSAYGVWNGYNTQITRYNITIDNLPDSRNGQKIAMIADIHVGAIRNVKWLNNIKTMIEAEGAQALLVAGDFYDGPKANDEQLAQALGEVQTTYGTYLAPGNHEEYGGLNNYVYHLEQAGVHVLNNSSNTIDGLQILGVDYSSTKTGPDLANILSGLNIDTSQPSILIKHVPNNPEVVEQFGIDLQVAGHVHQGQVRPGPWITRKIYGAFAYGMNQIGLSTIITTSGVGSRGPPQRVGTRSEIVIITLVK